MLKRPMDYSLVPPLLEDQARKYFEDGDSRGLLVTLGNERGLPFVFDNALALIERGIYEQALVDAYVSVRTNWHHWPLSAIESLFSIADREKLRAAGDPLPDGESFTLYRGVAGTGKARHICGYSWTSDLEKAKWFANRYPHLGEPAVFVTTAKASDILFYCSDRGENDFVYRSKKHKRLMRCEREVVSHSH